jgi:hypothetical protein
MPLLFVFLAGAGIGGWGFSQADDAIETVTGERGGIPWLQLLVFAIVAYYLWRFMKGKVA